MTFREIMLTPGHTIELQVFYTYVDEQSVMHQVYLLNDDIVRLKQFYNGGLTGSIMQCAEIETFQQIPDQKMVDLTITAKYGTNTATKTQSYRIKGSTYMADTKTYVHEASDLLLDWMIPYEPISNITYPCTIQQFFTKLCNSRGWTTNITLVNQYEQLDSDIYTDKGMSYRDVLDDICTANGILVYKYNFQIRRVQLGTTPFTIDDDVLMNNNIQVNEHYGPINTITLSRVGFDNAYYPTTLPSPVKDFIIQDNQMLNDDNRLDYAQEIYSVLNGVEYDTYDLQITPVGLFDPLEQITIQTGDNTYSSYVFNDEITYEGGGETETIYATLPKNVQIDYQYATADKEQDREAKIIVDKLNSDLSLVGKTINLTADDIKITSTNFSVDENGNMNCTSGTFSGNINTSTDCTIGNNLYVGQNQSPNNSGTKLIYFTDKMWVRRFYTTGGGDRLELAVKDSGGNYKGFIAMSNQTTAISFSSIDCGQNTTNGYNDTWVSFNKAFSSPPKVVCTAFTSTAGVGNYTMNVYGTTTNGFYAFQSSGQNTNVTFNWIAIE